LAVAPKESVMPNPRRVAVAVVPTAEGVAHELAQLDAAIHAEAAQAADEAAAHHLFRENWSRLSPRTTRRHEGDLALFAMYLGEVRAIDPASVVSVGARLPYQPEAWRNTTWGLVQGFIDWQLNRGFALGSINVRLATVKRYCKLAMTAGTLDPGVFQRISTLRGFGGMAARNVDARRAEQQIPTRIGAKKAAPTPLDEEQVAQLLQQPDTPIGRRDALLLCLLLDHGLRVGEIAGLTMGDLSLATRMLTFYRPKVHLSQAHRLTPETCKAARRYLRFDRAGAAPEAPLLIGGSREGPLEGTFGVRAMQLRVRQLGQLVGVATLSPHDCRHRWATRAAQAGTPITDLRDAGGWANFDTPSRYVERAKVANAGVRLTRPARPVPEEDEGE
jgi:integrase